MRKLFVRVFVFLLLATLVPLGFLAGCQSKLIYFPRPYPAGEVGDWARRTGGKAIDYRTSQGAQRAFLQGNLKSPVNLWIVCGGNGTVALDWSDWISAHAPKEDAWLLVDFPGYGDCQGAPTPGRIRESLAKCVPLAMAETGVNAGRLRFFGHSLGGVGELEGIPQEVGVLHDLVTLVEVSEHNRAASEKLFGRTDAFVQLIIRCVLVFQRQLALAR